MEGDCNVYAHSSLWMHPTRPDRYNAKMVYKELYEDLPKFSEKIREREGRGCFAGHWFRNKNETVSRLIHWIPKHGRRKPDRPPLKYVDVWTRDIWGTDSNTGQKALEGHSSSRIPLYISQVSQVSLTFLGIPVNPSNVTNDGSRGKKIMHLC